MLLGQKPVQTSLKLKALNFMARLTARTSESFSFMSEVHVFLNQISLLLLIKEL